jgi:hypothetical protein
MQYLKIGQWKPVVAITENARSDNASRRLHYRHHDSVFYSTREEAEAIIKSHESQAIQSKMVIIRGEDKNGDLTVAKGRGWLRVKSRNNGYAPCMLVDIGGNDVWLNIHNVIMSS